MASLASVALAVLKRPFVWYNAQLERRPVLVKSLTSGLTYAAGDAIAQKAEHMQATRNGLPVKPFKLNWKRLGIFFVYGSAIAGPMYHYWFSKLDLLPAAMFQLRQTRQRAELLKAYALLRRHDVEVNLKLDRLPKAKPFPKWAEKGMKIAADQLVFSSLYTLVFFIAVGMMTGGVDKYIAESKLHALDDFSASYEELLHERYKAAASKGPDAAIEKSLLALKAKLEASAISQDQQQQQQGEAAGAAAGSSSSGAAAGVAPAAPPKTAGAASSAATLAAAAATSTAAAPGKGGKAPAARMDAAAPPPLTSDFSAAAAVGGAGVAAASAAPGAGATSLVLPGGATTADVSRSIDHILSVLRAEQATKTLSWGAIWRETWRHMQEVYVTTYLADCAVWPVLQYVNFSYVPVQYQTLFVNIANLGWNTFLSLQANAHH